MPSMFARARWRLLILVVAVAGAFLVWRWSGVSAGLEAEILAERIRAAGVLGIGLYLVAFAAGELTHVPGFVFVGLAVGVWGPAPGSAIAVLGAFVANWVAFVVVRRARDWITGGAPPRFFERFRPQLEAHALRTVIVLRLLFLNSPPLNWALALSPVSARDYLVGTLIGIVPGVVGTALLLDQLLLESEPLVPRPVLVGVVLAVVVAALVVRRARGRRQG